MEKQLIGTFAKMMGTTVRTLRYYDKLDLIKPDVNENGQKVYGLEEQRLFQKISVCKYFGMSLAEIKDSILTDESVQEQFISQKEILKTKRAEIDKAIETLERTTALVNKKELDILNEELYWLVNMFRLEHEQLLILMKHCSKEQIQAFLEQGEDMGDVVSAKWYQKLHELIKDGVDPTSQEAQAVATYFMEKISGHERSAENLQLIEEMLNNDDLIKEFQSLSTRYVPPELEQYSKKMMNYYMEEQNLQ
ncbi:MerR family transcriptional regulator [Virgibacillus oceani]